MDNINITVDQALSVLETFTEKRKKRLHTFVGMAFGLFGCDMDLTAVKKLLKKAKEDEIAIAGPNMQGVNHGVAVFTADQGWLFLATDTKKLKDLLGELVKKGKDPKEKIKDELIARANEIAKANFMDYPDYDENDPITDIAGALTVLVWDNMPHTSEVETSELYDFFTEKFGKDK